MADHVVDAAGTRVRGSYDEWHRALGAADALDTPWHRMVRQAIDVQRDLAQRKVLEIACGRGDFAAWCAALSTPPARLIAADFSSVAVEAARRRVRRAGVSFCQGDAERMPFASGAFDTVICCETLEHLGAPRSALGELARVLRPGGRLYLTTPNYLGLTGAYRGYLRLTRRRYSE